MFDGAIEEVESPENPRGPNLFRLVMFKATDKACHKKEVETDKPKVMPMAWVSLLMMWAWPATKTCRTMQLASNCPVAVWAALQ